MVFCTMLSNVSWYFFKNIINETGSEGWNKFQIDIIYQTKATWNIIYFITNFSWAKSN